MSRIYLAGPMDGLAYADAMNWRATLSVWLRPYDIQALSPMRDQQVPADGVVRDVGECFYGSPAVFTERDLLDIRRSDLVLVNLNDQVKPSIGTAVEIGYAYALQKPIVLVAEEGTDIHPMVEYMTPLRVDTLSDGFSMVLHLLGK